MCLVFSTGRAVLRQLHLRKLTLYEAVIPNTNFYLGPQVIWGFAIFKSDENGSMDKIFETRCVLKLELTLSFGNRIVKDFSVHGSVWEDKS